MSPLKMVSCFSFQAGRRREKARRKAGKIMKNRLNKAILVDLEPSVKYNYIIEIQIRSDWNGDMGKQIQQ